MVVFTEPCLVLPAWLLTGLLCVVIAGMQALVGVLVSVPMWYLVESSCVYVASGLVQGVLFRLLLQRSLASDKYSWITEINALQQVVHTRVESSSTSQLGLFSIVSHEINTCLNAIIGSMQILDVSGLPPSQSTYVETALHTSKVLSSTCNDMLDYVQCQQGDLRLSISSFNLHSAISQIERAFQEVANAKDLTFNVWMGSDLPVYFTGDEYRIRQVITILLAYAFKENPDVKSVSLLVFYGADFVEFVVKYDRVSHDQPRMSTMYHLSDANDAVTPGTGLDLALCNSLVALMGGQLCEDGACLVAELKFRLRMHPAEEQNNDVANGFRKRPFRSFENLDFKSRTLR
eukprot:NODE_4260_length_1090_cov_67.088935_g4061_i0.p1 GENE.NODE_4260_length_1090_cov_67.088935_g4061_i0~~NODE_4260_length_1090_cov_67.088935_g4061_i0.p1  ORF type:complete len:362 (-),score=38.42 NODE_4260_length_1090_cov_67.088935_g4061_i0:5-1045(-)